MERIPNITANVSVQPGYLYANTAILDNLGGNVVSDIFSVGDHINIEEWNTIYAEITNIDDGTSEITFKSPIWLTFPDVAYCYADVANQTVKVADFNIANTPAFDIVNNKNYTFPEKHMFDIAIADDRVIIDGETYIINSTNWIYENYMVLVDSITFDWVPITEEVFGSVSQPKLFTINRIISTDNIFKQTSY
jgi:hypothetical protein